MVSTLFRLKGTPQVRDAAYTVASLTAIALVISCMLSAVPQAREAARRTQCHNSMKLIGRAVDNYCDGRGAFPASRLGEPPASWRVRILPFIDASTLDHRYHYDAAWDDPRNRPVADTIILQYRCPSDKSRSGEPLTSYAMLTGAHTVGGDGQNGMTIREITDGATYTMAVIEARGRNIRWA